MKMNADSVAAVVTNSELIFFNYGIARRRSTLVFICTDRLVIFIQYFTRLIPRKNFIRPLLSIFGRI